MRLKFIVLYVVILIAADAWISYIQFLTNLSVFDNVSRTCTAGLIEELM